MDMDIMGIGIWIWDMDHAKNIATLNQAEVLVKYKLSSTLSNA